MILEVEHTLKYQYSDFVNLNPHYLYLTPVPSPFQHVYDFVLEVSPKADKITRNIDQEGNIQHVCFVNTPANTFEVKSSFKIVTREFNALDFIFFPFKASKLPFKYPGKLSKYFDFFVGLNPINLSVKALADDLAAKANRDTIGFIFAIIAHISENFRYISRERGDALAAHETLETQSGSCRDFSVLMMALCASQGLMARFVSGYLYGNERHQHDLHAWVEVFLPGGGWRGFDPTEGQIVNLNYITLAESLEASGISPVRGTFRSFENVESDLETHVKIIDIT